MVGSRLRYCLKSQRLLQLLQLLLQLGISALHLFQLLELDWNQEKSIEIQWFITTFPVSVVDPIINI